MFCKLIYIDLCIKLLRIFEIYMNGHIIRTYVDSTTRAQRRLLDRRIIPYKRNRFERCLPGCQEEWRLRHVPRVNVYQHVVLFQNLCHYHVSPHNVPQSYPLPNHAAFAINQLSTSTFSSPFSQVSILRPCLCLIMTNASAPYYFGISREHFRT